MVRLNYLISLNFPEASQFSIVNMLYFYNKNNIEEKITTAILTKVAIKLNSIPPLPFENKEKHMI